MSKTFIAQKMSPAAQLDQCGGWLWLQNPFLPTQFWREVLVLAGKAYSLLWSGRYWRGMCSSAFSYLPPGSSLTFPWWLATSLSIGYMGYWKRFWSCREYGRYQETSAHRGHKEEEAQFLKPYKDWTEEEWSKVMFSDKSMVRINRAASTRVRRPPREQWVQPEVHGQGPLTLCQRG